MYPTTGVIPQPALQPTPSVPLNDNLSSDITRLFNPTLPPTLIAAEDTHRANTSLLLASANAVSAPQALQSSSIDPQPKAVLANVTNKSTAKPQRPRPKKKTAEQLGDDATQASADAIEPSLGTAASTVELVQPKWVKDYFRATQKLLCPTNSPSEKNSMMLDKAFAVEKLFSYKVHVFHTEYTNIDTDTH
jgi:hypothetical protein